MHDEQKPNEKTRDKDANFGGQAFALAGAPFTSDQEQQGGHERPEHHDVVRVTELGQADSGRGGEDSENRKDRLCGEKPAKELSQVFADDLLKGEAAGKNDGARDDPIDVVPKHS
jgi:hypothetical protein